MSKKSANNGSNRDIRYRGKTGGNSQKDNITNLHRDVIAEIKGGNFPPENLSKYIEIANRLIQQSEKKNNEYMLEFAKNIYSSLDLSSVSEEDAQNIRDVIHRAYDHSPTDKYASKVREIERDVFPRVSENRLEKSLKIISVLSFIGAIMFISSGLTGSAVSTSFVSNSSFLGIILFLVGLVAGFFWLKKRK